MHLKQSHPQHGHGLFSNLPLSAAASRWCEEPHNGSAGLLMPQNIEKNVVMTHFQVAKVKTGSGSQ